MYLVPRQLIGFQTVEAILPWKEMKGRHEFQIN